MLMSFLVTCRKYAQADDLHKQFLSKFEGRVRDCRRKSIYSRYWLNLIFRAKNPAPFIEYAKELSELEYVKDSIEIAYDDKEFHLLSIEDRTITEHDDPSHSSEYINFQELTGNQDNLHKAMEIWKAEVKPTSGEYDAKQSRLVKGREHWNQEIERAKAKEENRASSQTTTSSGSISVGYPPSRVVYKLPPNLTKTKILEIITKLNTSGEVLIPAAIYRSDIDPNMDKKAMVDFCIDYDRSETKGTIFKECLRRVMDIESQRGG